MNENRRGFMAALAAFFGVGAVAKACDPVVPKLEGFIVFFVNVGSLPPFKAEAFIERLKDQWKKGESSHVYLQGRSLVSNWQTIWIPSRTQETHAEFYPVNGEKDVEGKLKQIEGFLLDYEDKASHSGTEVDIDDLPLRLRTIDYVMLMLGAPVKHVDQSQVACAYNNVVEHVKNTGNAVNSMYLTEQFVKEGTLAFAKMFVGRRRMKGAEAWDNELAVYEEGRDGVRDWTEKLEEMI